MSKLMTFDGLNNVRDLGGMRGADGRLILPGKLIRSGHLHPASEKDISRLAEMAAVIVDFRTDAERNEKPDPIIPGTQAVHLPVFERLAAGVTREEKSDEAAFAIVARDPEKARQFMIHTYAGFITSDFCVSQYRNFVSLLMKPHEKAVLWHCTAGKDRAGFASVIVETLLGVSAEDIMADYLSTNEYLREESHRLNEMVSRQMGGLDERMAKALDYLFGAQEEYLTAVYQAAEENYGSFARFLSDGLGISSSQQERLKAMYLA